jgi:hypothetical protein
LPHEPEKYEFVVGKVLALLECPSILKLADAQLPCGNDLDSVAAYAEQFTAEYEAL